MKARLYKSPGRPSCGPYTPFRNLCSRTGSATAKTRREIKMTPSIVGAVTCCFLAAALCACAEARRRLCGSALADAVAQACSAGYRPGKRAGHFSETLYKDDSRTAPTIHGKQRSDKAPSLSSLNQLWTAAERKAVEALGDLEDIRRTSLTKTSGDDEGVDPGEGRSKRQAARTVTIVDECCRQACSLQTLLRYCPENSVPVTEVSLIQLGQLLGFTTPGVSTRRPEVATTTPEVFSTYRPAQIVRGRTRGRNSTFFYVTFGNQATRSPLITE